VGIDWRTRACHGNYRHFVDGPYQYQYGYDLSVSFVILVTGTEGTYIELESWGWSSGGLVLL
jgi:hypothetical protein